MLLAEHTFYRSDGPVSEEVGEIAANAISRC